MTRITAGVAHKRVPCGYRLLVRSSIRFMPFPPDNWQPGEGRSVKTTWPVLEWIVHSASDQVKHSRPGGANSPWTSQVHGNHRTNFRSSELRLASPPRFRVGCVGRHRRLDISVTRHLFVGADVVDALCVQPARGEGLSQRSVPLAEAILCSVVQFESQKACDSSRNATVINCRLVKQRRANKSNIREK